MRKGIDSPPIDSFSCGDMFYDTPDSILYENDCPYMGDFTFRLVESSPYLDGECLLDSFFQLRFDVGRPLDVDEMIELLTDNE